MARFFGPIMQVAMCTRPRSKFISVLVLVHKKQMHDSVIKANLQFIVKAFTQNHNLAICIFYIPLNSYVYQSKINS